ncbi:MAG TPA: dihydroorotate dehydrogenase electron transfer subunit, partial [Mobilitalea sp.]|nr:dihydroorotate dehydrogenase electron transfer subunit [Mobilitalea sp.]
MTVAAKRKAVVINTSEIADQIFSLWLKAPDVAENAKPGQFVSLYCNEGSRFLPRPISICEIDKKGGLVRLVYR